MSSMHANALNLLTGACLLVACGKDDQPAPARAIEVLASEYAFDPRLIVAAPAERLEVTLRNVGQTVHGLEFEWPGGEHSGLAGTVAPGQSASMTLTTPDEPGDYVFYCPVGDHRERGMVGTLTVLEQPEVALTELLAGLTAPVTLGFPDDGSGRMFVVDQIGVIQIVRDGTPLQQPFLDVRDRMYPDLDESYDERGLLGFAFHPQFASNGRFFVYYSAPLRPGAPEDHDHTSHISEFRLDPDHPDRADPDSERLVMAVDQPQRVHNGGTLAFGPDGFLYISLGDGGAAYDIGIGHPPLGNGQDITTLLGSILRIAIDGPEPYGVPADNPFVGKDGADEIFAYGLRNAYRMAFDRGGDHALYAGDVGQNRWEEVSIIHRGGNYGWNRREGAHCFDPERPKEQPTTCAATGPRGEPLIPPVIEFANSANGGPGQAVIGGHVYRGADLPALIGRYIFGSWSFSYNDPSGAIFYAVPRPGSESLWPMQKIRISTGEDGELGHYLLGFAEDLDGELYVLTNDRRGPGGDTGKVFKMVNPPNP